MDDITKKIEREKQEVARTIKPHIKTQAVLDADDRQTHDHKRVQKKVVMTGETQTFTIPKEYGFTKPDSVIVTLSPKSVVAMYGEMLNNNSFKITAASALTDIEIKVLMRGY